MNNAIGNAIKKADRLVSQGISTASNHLSSSNERRNDSNDLQDRPPPFAPSEGAPAVSKPNFESAPAASKLDYSSIPEAVVVSINPVPVPPSSQTLPTTHPVDREDPGFGCICCCVPPPWVLALVLSFIGWNLAGSVLYSCDTANVFDLNCDDLSDVDQPSRGIAKLIGTTAFVLGSLCTAVIWLSSVCCCCVHPMNAPQWKKCGGALIAAAVLEGVSFIVFLESFDFDSSKIGSGGQSAILAVICWIGAGISASAYSEQNSSNTIVAQRRAARS